MAGVINIATSTSIVNAASAAIDTAATKSGLKAQLPVLMQEIAIEMYIRKHNASKVETEIIKMLNDIKAQGKEVRDLVAQKAMSEFSVAEKTEWRQKSMIKSMMALSTSGVLEEAKGGFKTPETIETSTRGFLRKSTKILRSLCKPYADWFVEVAVFLNQQISYL